MIKPLWILSFLLFNLFILSNLHAQRSVEWLSDMEYDFGLLDQFEGQETKFTFKNISQDTILIDNVRTTCGCTAPDWDLEPIPPGENRDIRIVYDANKIGYFRKKIKVFFSHQRKGDVLYVEGEVE